MCKLVALRLPAGTIIDSQTRNDGIRAMNITFVINMEFVSQRGLYSAKQNVFFGSCGSADFPKVSYLSRFLINEWAFGQKATP